MLDTKGDVMIRADGVPTHRTLMCNPLRAEYSFTTRRGALWMDENNACDMSGCIMFFQAMDQDVEEISAYEGGELDIVYKKKNGSWKAYCKR